MTINYTAKESEVINAAWASLIHFADTKRAGDSGQLCAALKAERKEVPSRVAAKALLLRTLGEACDVKAACAVTSLADLWTLRSAHRDLVAYAHHYNAELLEAGVIDEARKATGNHETAFRRALEDI